MIVSNVMILNEIGSAARNRGARCSLRVMDNMCSHMAQPSTSSDYPKQFSDEIENFKERREKSSPLPTHPLTKAVGAIYCIEDFDILELLGEGFFSQVLKVRHKENQSIMVLKVSKSGVCGSRRISHADAAREAGMLRKMKHNNILRMNGLCVERNRNEWDLHLLVGYCSGGSLSRLILAKNTHFPWRQRIKFAVEIADAMTYIHAQRIIHRDLTSMNVLLCSEEDSAMRAVVADFGLSCNFPKRGENLPQVGTTYFMSPECLKEEYYDEKSDVFSFGVILCQLIARIDSDPESGLHRTSNFGLDYVLFTPCCPPDTPLEFLKIAFNCCLLDPFSRPDFADILRSLQKLLAAVPPSPKLNKDAREPRLGRSRSDAALKKPKGLSAAGRKLSSNSYPLKFCQPLIEGMPDESSISAMEELARDVAREDPSYDHTNPFMVHERYRKERKIFPRVDNRRRSETKPELPLARHLASINGRLRRRWSSVPCHINSEMFDEDELDCQERPGGIPMVYRDFDMKFVKSMKRFPSRRHTMIPDCLTVKSSFNISSINSTNESDAKENCSHTNNRLPSVMENESSEICVTENPIILRQSFLKNKRGAKLILRLVCQPKKRDRSSSKKVLDDINEPRMAVKRSGSICSTISNPISRHNKCTIL